MFVQKLRRQLLHCAALALSIAPPVAGAQAAPPLTLREAIAAAQNRNPDLQVFVFDLKAADAAQRQAALRPPLELGASLENFGGTGDSSGVQILQATLLLSGVVELGGKRDARVTAADAARDTVLVARQTAQLDILAEVTRRFIAVLTLQEQQRVARRSTGLADSTLRASDLRVRAAKAPHAELDRATIALERARLEEQTIAGRLEAARRTLAAMWGADRAVLNDQPFGELAGDLYEPPSADELPVLIERYRRNPDFLRFASEERLKDAELRLAATQRHADVTLGAGLSRLQGTRGLGLAAAFSMPLFAGSRAEPGIAEAAARRDAVGARRDAVYINAIADLGALHRELRDAIASLELLSGTVLPKMEEALNETEYAFERGRYSYLELIDAQREYLDVQRSRIEAGERAQLLATEIERLTNEPLTTP